MITQQSLLLAQLCDRLQQGREIQNNVAAFRSRHERLDALEQRLRSASRFLIMARRKGLPVATVPRPDQAATLGALRQLAVDFEADPKVILEGNRYRDLLLVLESTVSSTEFRAKSVWHSYAAEQFNPASDEVLALYVRLGLFGEMVTALRALARTLTALALQDQVTESELEVFQHGVEEYARLWRQVDLSVLPRDVQAFLRACGEPAGASLDLLTEDVLVWLRERGAVDRFKIRPFSPGTYGSRQY